MLVALLLVTLQNLIRQAYDNEARCRNAAHKLTDDALAYLGVTA